MNTPIQNSSIGSADEDASIGSLCIAGMRIQRRMPLVAFAIALLLASGCDRRTTDAEGDLSPDTGATVPAPTDTPPSDAATGTAAPSTVMPPSGMTAMPPGASGAMPNEADRGFLGDAMRGNEEEIAVTALAMDRGGDKVKSLARMLNTDHRTLRDKLRSAAGTAAPSPANAPADLRALDGTAFDDRVLALLREHHETSIRKYTEASTDTALGDDVRALATQTLPTLRRHLEEVKKVQGRE